MVDVDATRLEALSITRTSTAERVADALRRMILDGGIESGTRLREEPLARSLGVSRNTVREAITLLVHQGLVTRHQHRGAVVVQLDADDVADIYRTRILLEVSAIRGSAQATNEQLARLGEAVDALAVAATSHDPQQIVAHDLGFHRAVAGLLGSKRLEGLFDLIQGELHLCLVILSAVDREYDDPRPLVAEHRAIYDGIMAGRRSEAAQLMEDHLRVNAARLLEIVSSSRATEFNGE
jgi:DNA-binding GntR family transcriptional regulator